jgi:DNA-binding NarL/FixJ family response regulator
MVSLTRREADVLNGLSRGLTNVEIAAELNVNPSTVKSHVRTLYRKLGVSNRTQAAVQYLSEARSGPYQVSAERPRMAQPPVL